jgi:hypothetical protein
MAGTLRDYSSMTMGGPRGRSGLAVDASNVRYPDVVIVPPGCFVLAIKPEANTCWLLNEGVVAGTALDAALATANGIEAVADSWGSLPVQPGSAIAVYSETAGTAYGLAFYERAAEAV